MGDWRARNLDDLIQSGEFTVDKVSFGVDVADIAIDMSDTSHVMLKHPIWENHYKCPGCKHWRNAIGIVDCRHIAPTEGTTGQLMMCDGCWTYMVFEAGKRQSLYGKVATDVQSAGPGIGFKARQTIVRDLVRRKRDRLKAVDDVLDRVADAMEITTDLQNVSTLGIKLPEPNPQDGSDDFLDENIAGDFMLQRKMFDGVLITKRTTRNMTVSLFMELHGAPPAFLNTRKGRPMDFQP